MSSPVQKSPPLVFIAPQQRLFGEIAEACCLVGKKRFANFVMPTITAAGPITTLDFGNDGSVEVIDREAALPAQTLLDHPQLSDALASVPNHALFLAKANGESVMDRAIGGLNLMVLGWALGEVVGVEHLYWAPSDQWADRATWAEFAIPAAETLKLPIHLWVKITADQTSGATSLGTLGLRPLVGYELTWPLKAVTKAALGQLSSLISYILDPSTPVPQAGQTFGGGDVPEFKLTAQEGAVQPTLTITQVDHGLVC